MIVNVYPKKSHLIKFLLGIIFLAKTLNCPPLTAQIPDIQPIPPPTRPLPELPKPLPLQPEILTPSPPPPVVEEIPTNTSGTITIKAFRFQGNTVFSDEELTEITQSYLNRPITFAELLEARSAITQRYIDEGYTTSGAFIPLQRSQDGIVTIEIVEGTIGEINITMTGKLRSG